MSAKPPIKPKDSGVHLHLRVQPNASRNRLIVEDDGRLRLSITTPPVDGKANKAVIATLAKILKVPKRTIQLNAGLTSRDKTLFIDEIDIETVSSLINNHSE